MSPKDAIKPKLVIIEGNDKGKVIPIESGTTVIGRTKGDVILQDPRVSRSHVALSYDERSGKLSYTDLKSLNGTLVNGNPVETGVLVDGDRLQIGNTLFDCQLSAATEIGTRPEVAAPTPEKKKRPALQELQEISESSIAAKPEPHFGDAFGTFEQSKPEPVAHAQAEAEEEADEVTSSSQIHMPKSRKRTLLAMYREMPSRQRNLVLAIVLFGGIYLFMGGDKPGSEELDRQITSVRALEKEGKYTEAIQKAESLVQSYDHDPQLWITLGGLYSQQRRFEPAIQAYRKAKQADPDHPIATVRLIALYERTGLKKEAQTQMQDLDRLLKEGKHSRELFVEAANLFLEFPQLNHSPEKALILSRALQNELAVDSAIGYKLEAQLMFQQNQNDEARKVIERGLQRDPQDEWLLENLAFAKLSLQDTAGALEVVENWIRIYPNATKALLVMAYLKFRDKNYLGALPYLQKIVQIASQNQGDPHLPEALHLMGQIYWAQGQAAEAKSLFMKSCEMSFKEACEHESVKGGGATIAPVTPAPASAPPAAAPPAEPTAGTIPATAPAMPSDPNPNPAP